MPQDAGLPDPSSHLPPHLRDPIPVAGRLEPSRPAPSAPPAPPGLSAAPDVMALLSALRHRWVSAVLLGTTLGAIAGVAMWYLLMPRHTAFAQLQVGYMQLPILSGGNPTPGDFKTFMKTTADAVTSR